MFGDRGHECVGSNGVLIDVTVVNVKAGWMLDETHDRPVLAVDVDSRFPGRVHGDSAHSSDLGQRQDVRDGVLVIPDGAKVWKVANHVGILVPPVRDSAEYVWAGAHVVEHVLVAEHRNRGLRVQ